MLLSGDSYAVLRKLPADSIDSVVTDPPYDLISGSGGFMGKAWDATGIAFDPAFWREVGRVLKPGGHLLAFGGTRTYHRMATAIEDAGFEIRDSVHWTTGSGFPKSMDISKAIDKRPGVVQHRTFAAHLTARREAAGLTRLEVSERVVGTRSGACWNWEHHQFPEARWWPALRDLLGLEAAWGVVIAEADRECIGERPATQLAVAPGEGRDRGAVTLDVTAPATDAAKQWAGWGTALKPSHEPIVVARKPLIGTVAANVLEHGTGALNIDGCRIKPVAGEVVDCGLADPANRQGVFGGTVFNQTSNKERFQQAQRESIERTNTLGRWPANTLLTHGPNCDAGGCEPGCPVAEMDRQSGSVGAGDGGASRFFNVFQQDNDPNDPLWSAPPFLYVPKPARSERDAGCEDLPTRTAQETVGRDPDSAGAKNPRAGAGRGANAPLYYCTHCNVSLQGGRAAAVCAESADGKHTPEARGVLQGVLNPHPTVKPVALMRHLCRLVTPPGGIVLDPFGGSGTTGCAAVLEGFRPILIEREAEYLPVIQARLKHWTAKAKASGGTNGGEGER